MKEAAAKSEADSQAWGEREGKRVVTQRSGIAATRAQVSAIGTWARVRRAVGGRREPRERTGARERIEGQRG